MSDSWRTIADRVIHERDDIWRTVADKAVQERDNIRQQLAEMHAKNERLQQNYDIVYEGYRFAKTEIERFREHGLQAAAELGTLTARVTQLQVALQLYVDGCHACHGNPDVRGDGSYECRECKPARLALGGLPQPQVHGQVPTEPGWYWYRSNVTGRVERVEVNASLQVDLGEVCLSDVGSALGTWLGKA